MHGRSMAQSASSDITNVSALLSMDEAMVGFVGAARPRVIFRAKPMGQGVQLPATIVLYNDFLGGINYADQQWPTIHPGGALHALGESAERFMRDG